MTDLRVLILSALEDRPLPRHLDIRVPGDSLERRLHGKATVFDVARGIAECQSGPWPLIEAIGGGFYRLTEAGRAQLGWYRWSEQAAG